MSEGIKERTPMGSAVSGLMHPQHTVDLVIPWGVAAPRSLSLFQREPRIRFDRTRRQATIGHRKQHQGTQTLWRRAKKG